MDESYTLKILNGVAHLKANSAWGALRGLDTFSQLTYFMDSDHSNKVNTIFKDN
jgi:hypothetical protein